MNEDFANVEDLNFPEISTEEQGKEEVKFESEPKVEFEAPKEEQPVVPVTEVKTEETKTEEVSDVKVTNPPTQYNGESDIQFNLRKQIYDAGQAKAMATTEEEKSYLSQHIKTLRGELGKSGKKETVETPQESKQVETTQSQSKEDEIAEAKKILNEMGYISKEDLPNYVQEIVQGQSRQSEQQDAIRDFYSTRKDIANNPAQREVLERLVVEKFNITPQSSRQDLSLAMDMAASYLFPKQNNNAQVRDAADKRDLVGFSSNTKSEAKQNVDDATRSELKSLGWSDEDIAGFA